MSNFTNVSLLLSHTNFTRSHQGKDFDHFSGTIGLYKVLFALFDALGIIGNILVIFTIFLNPNMRSTIYYLLANLAFSDLLFAILAPFHMSMILDRYNWKYGAVFCRVYYFVFRSFYAFSIMNLILITVERFLATRYPLSFRGKPKRTLALILGTWVLSFVFSSPFLSVMTYKELSPEYSICFQEWPGKLESRAYYTFVYVILYFIPLALMAFMYALISMTLRKQPLVFLADKNDTQRKQFKARKRMSLLVIVIVVAFFVCWSPWNIIEFVEHARDTPWKNPKILPTVKNYAVLATILSTTVNPFLFSFMSFEFRTGFRFVFVRISSWYRLRRGSGDESPTGSSQRTGNMDLSRRSGKRNSNGGEGNKTEARALV
ncbi:neuromedin-K receptor-like [Dendronephthya gigantea]|uniref:neuromedin-K receptor-like n=1 Tax=Dendronephthya gigantea TaxID=151771 RepID=UPI00106CF316|nr:neuromedin-K receptor-like [Dendronephthya gigantea]XP_028399397.1 neuromedin-K receptor-like [Dendronephthya gigantea]XP_028399398.1 neuromedin-K receptor-like [Dendronephthya gigantea]